MIEIDIISVIYNVIINEINNNLIIMAIIVKDSEIDNLTISEIDIVLLSWNIPDYHDTVPGSTL